VENGESLVEKSLYFLIALVINFILFGYLSLHLIAKDLDIKLPRPIEVFLEEGTSIEEVVIVKSKSSPKEESRAIQSSIPVEAKKGDVPLSPVKEDVQEEPSILSEIEKKIASGKSESVQGGSKVGESIGEISAQVSQGGVGFFKESTRQIAYVPNFPKIITNELPSTLQVRVWIEPSGRVSKVEIIKRSGVPEVDQAIVGFVRGIRFEPIKDNIIQTGVMTFRFEGG